MQFPVNAEEFIIELTRKIYSVKMEVLRGVHCYLLGFTLTVIMSGERIRLISINSLGTVTVFIVRSTYTKIGTQKY